MAALAVVSVSSDAQAQFFRVDQRCVWSGGSHTYGNIITLGPMGQEFVPEFTAVNRVEFQVFDFGELDGLGATVVVMIRIGAILGPVLGTSVPVHLPDLHEGVVEFDFAEDVPLVPGELYVMEIFVLEGSNFMLVYDSSPGGQRYPFGRLITWAGPSETVDAWFREGIVWGGTPVESETWGAIKGLYR
jgi:hypothetical protein